MELGGSGGRALSIATKRGSPNSPSTLSQRGSCPAGRTSPSRPIPLSVHMAQESQETGAVASLVGWHHGASLKVRAMARTWIVLHVRRLCAISVRPFAVLYCRPFLLSVAPRRNSETGNVSVASALRRRKLKQHKQTELSGAELYRQKIKEILGKIRIWSPTTTSSTAGPNFNHDPKVLFSGAQSLSLGATPDRGPSFRILF